MAKYADATVSGFTDYWDERGIEIPGAWDEPSIEAALLVASEWIDGTYGSLFSGYKTGGYSQDREWPRTGAMTNTQPTHSFPNDVVPVEVIQAVYEAAYRHRNNPGSLLIDYTPNKYKRVSIDGALSVEWNGFNFASDIQSTFPRIDRLLSILFDTSGNFSAYSGDAPRV